VSVLDGRAGCAKFTPAAGRNPGRERESAIAKEPRERLARAGVTRMGGDAAGGSVAAERSAAERARAPTLRKNRQRLARPGHRTLGN
jgi:hypothetical protein